MEKFDYQIPVHIVFGNGRVRELGNIAKQYGNNALVVTGRNSAKNNGQLEKVVASLSEAGVSSAVFDKISPNPRSDEVDEAIALIRMKGYNLIIGLGGGSPMDAAKAISVGLPYSSIREVIGGVAIERDSRHLPVITIPTTSGSGAEVTKGAIITDTIRHLKSGVRGPALFPRVAIVDPELTYSMSKDVTATTGFDALTHAIETYVVPKANTVTDAHAQKAIELIGQYLPRAIADGEDTEAREGMALASSLGGMNIANVGTSIAHRLQQAMGGVIEISHAVGMATIYPAWLERAAPYRKEKFGRVAELLGKESKDGYEAVIEFMRDVRVDYRLGDFAKRSDIDSFLEKLTGDLSNDPIPNITPGLMREIFEESF